MEIIKTNLNFKAMTKRGLSDITKILLHHAEASICTAEDIHRWHLNKGWAGAGYNYLVRKDGKIYELRDIEYVPAAAYGSNTCSINICAEGKYMTEDMPEVQKEALKWLVAELKKKYNITIVQKHKDVCATFCPGDRYPFTEIVNAEIKPAIDEKKERIKELQSLLNKVYNSRLAVDGIIGTHTNNALRKVALKNYCANELVKFIQRRLIMNGRSVGNCGADGKYGKDTENAVRKFQTTKGLVVDGIAGINTIKALI